MSGPIGDSAWRRCLNDLESSQTPAEVAEKVSPLVEWSIDNLREKYQSGSGGAPDWIEAESRIWKLGAVIQTMVKARRWRRRKGIEPLLELASKVVASKKYGKGRQMFALLIGDLGGRQYGRVLVDSLADGDVGGHSLDSLCKLKMGGYEKEVSPLTGHEVAWIRKLAKRYMERSSGWE